MRVLYWAVAAVADVALWKVSCFGKGCSLFTLFKMFIAIERGFSCCWRHVCDMWVWTTQRLCSCCKHVYLSRKEWIFLLKILRCEYYTHKAYQQMTKGGKKAILKGTWNQQEKEVLGRCSKWQLVQVEKRWCLVFSCMYVSPLLSAAFILKGGIYLPRLLSVFFLCV